MITLSRTGQFYRFLNRYGAGEPGNICELITTLLLMFVGLTVGGVLIGIYLLGLVTLFLVPEYWASKFSLIISMIAIVTGAVLGCFYLSDRAERTETMNMVRAAYRGLKERYCPLVTFK